MKRRALALAAAFAMLTSTFTPVYANQVDLDVTGMFEEDDEYDTEDETEEYYRTDEDTTDGDIVPTAVYEHEATEDTSVPAETTADVTDAAQDDDNVTLGYSAHLEDEDIEEDDVTKEDTWYSWNASTGTLTLSGQLPSNGPNKSIAELIGIGYSDVQKIVILSGTKTNTDCTYMFYGMTNLTEITGMQYLNTSNTTNMSGMFFNCSSLKSLDLSCFDTRNCANMHEMFAWCTSLNALDISSFNMTNVNNVGRMFFECHKIIKLKLPSGFSVIPEMLLPNGGYSIEPYSFIGWSEDEAQTIQDNMIAGSGEYAEFTANETHEYIHRYHPFGSGQLTSWCYWDNETGTMILEGQLPNTAQYKSLAEQAQITKSTIKYIKIGNQGATAGNSAAYMFYSLSGLKEIINLDNLDTCRTENMEQMFGACANIKLLDLSGFDTHNVTNMKGMFDQCHSLTDLNISSFDIHDSTNCYNTDGMFSALTCIHKLDLPNGFIVDGGMQLPNKISSGETVLAGGPCLYKGWTKSGSSELISGSYTNAAFLSEGGTYIRKKAIDELDISLIQTEFSYGESINIGVKIEEPECHFSAFRWDFGFKTTFPSKSLTYYGSGTITSEDFYGCVINVYYDNNAGTGTVIIKGGPDSDYIGIVEREFTISPKSISDCTVTVSPTSYTYDGTAKKPTVTVKDGATTLIKDTDYTVAYSNNINAGTATVTVTGIGNYTGTKTSTFTIVEQKKAIGDCTITVSPTSYTYDGTAKEPIVTVKNGTTALTNGTHYSVAYSNNTNAGTAAVTVTGIGNYTGTATKTFSIAPKSITSATLNLSQTSYTYDGTAKTPDVTATDGTKTLVKDTDYTVSYSNNINAGTATATVTGKGNYTGTKAATFSIVEPKKAIGDCTITVSPASYTYDGTAKTPSVTVKNGTATLVKDTDYTVAYSNNINAGTATVIVTGIGSYTGTKTATFTIVEQKKAIGDCTITVSPTSYTYDGAAKTPDVTVKNGTIVLSENTHYTVAYSNNTNAGTATVTVTGMGSYTGTTTKTFKINAKSITSASLSLSQTSYTYDGTAKKPAVTVKDGATALTNGTHYTVAYSNNINAGTATVTVTGKGNYTGTKTATFTIVEQKKAIGDCTITVSPTSYTYDGSAKKPTITVKDGSTALTNGTHYSVTYSNNTNAGNATVTITGKDKYTGTATKTFKINAKGISADAVTLSTTSCTYDGGEKKPAVTVKDGNKTLVSGTDYTLTYSNNINAGTATATVTGKGNYSGKINKSYTIKPRSMSDKNLTVTVSPSSYNYDGNEKKPSVIAKYNSMTLVSEIDYDITYKNNVDPGTATVTLTGKGNYTGTATAEFTIVRVKTDKFIWGEDNWNFDNTTNNFSNYNVDEDIKKKLIKDFALSDRAAEELNYYIKLNNEYGWGGSCWGFSISMILAKQDQFHLSRYGGNDIVNKNTPSSKMISVLNFIQIMQSSSEYCQNIRQKPFAPKSYNNDSQKEMLNILEEACNSGQLVKLGYKIKNLYKSSGKITYGGHAVVAYGVEDCQYTSEETNKSYDKRILIADPNWMSVNGIENTACLYYNSETYDWIIPYWYYDDRYSSRTCYSNNNSKNYGYLNNIMVYNSIGEAVDLASEFNANHYIAGIEVDNKSGNESIVEEMSRTGNPNMDFAGFGPGSVGIARYDEEFADETMMVSNTEQFALWNPTAAYTLSYDKPSEYNVKMDYEDITYYADLTKAYYTLFKPDGSISMRGSNSDYEITMLLEDNEMVTDWYSFSVAGNETDNLTLTKIKDGFTLSSSNMNNIKLSGKGEGMNPERTFSTDYSKVFIYEKADNTIGIKVDTDDNGTYDTDIENVGAAPNITRVEPGNGKMNVTWNQIDNADSYIVYYKTGSTTKSVPRAATAKGALISGISNGTYEVWVTAMVNGKETPKSQSIEATVKGYYVPCKTQAIESGTIEISWDAFPNALRYRVVCVNPDSTVRDTKTTSKLSFKWQGLHNGEQYGFYVQPYINVGGYPATATEGVYPTFTRTDAKDKPYIQWTIPVNAPMITKLSLGNQKVWLYYESVPRATKYYIYYRQQGDTKDTLAGTTTNTKFLVAKLKNNVSTEFYVKALVDGKLTPLKRPATRTTRAGMKPTITVTAGQAALKWSKYTDCKASATKYKVIFVDANYKQIASRETSNLAFTWKSSALKKGTKYGFYVVPYVNGEYIPFGLSYAEDKANVVMFTAK